MLKGDSEISYVEGRLRTQSYWMLTQKSVILNVDSEVNHVECTLRNQSNWM